MKKNLRLIFILFLTVLAFFGLASISVAQVTTGGVTGTITDPKGEPLVGATVTALHVPTGAKYGSITDLDGRYSVRGMKVGGPYTITASYVGYKTETINGVYTELAQTLRQDFKLGEVAVEASEVVVTVDKNAFDRSKTGSSSAVGRDQFQGLPSISRNIGDYTRLNPQVSSAAGNNNSISGRGQRFNNLQIDGAVNNDLFGLGSNNGTPGGQTGAAPISLDAIQEVQVQLAPFDVRLSGFTGGLVNVITRSGTNEFHGSGYGFNRTQGLAGVSPDSLKTHLTNFSEVNTGVSVGGPIVKDKLFFFVNGEYADRNDPRLYTADGSNGNLFGVGQASGNTRTDTLAAKFLNILKTKYNYDPGTISSFTRQQPNYKFFTRLDYNWNETNKVTLRYNLVFAQKDNFYKESATDYYMPNSIYTYNNTQNAIVGQWNSTLNNTMFNEVIVGYTTSIDRRTTPGATFPFITVNLVTNSNAKYEAGTEQYSPGNRLNQRIIEFTDNFTLLAKKHTFTFGTHNEFFSFENGFFPNFNGTYSFSNLDSLAAGKANTFDLTYANGHPGTQPTVKFGVEQFGFYAQDEWAATPNLNVTGGIRLEYTNIPDKPKHNSRIDSTFNIGTPLGLDSDVQGKNIQTDVSISQVIISPRIGVNFDASGKKETIIRGGAGIFAGRAPFVWLSNNFSNDGVTFIRATNSNLGANGTTRFFDPTPDQNSQLQAAIAAHAIAPLGVIQRTEVDLFDPNFKLPESFRANFGLDQKLPYGFTATVEAIYAKTIYDVQYKDINLRTDSLYLEGVNGFSGYSPNDGRPIYRRNTPTATAGGSSGGIYNAGSINNTAFSNVYYITNTGQGYNFTASVELKKQVGDFSGSIAYAYNNAQDINSLTSDQASGFSGLPTSGNPNKPELARSIYEIRDRIVATLNYNIKWHAFGRDNWTTQVGLVYEGRTGRPFSYVYNTLTGVGDVNGDGFTGNDLIYVPKNANDILLGTRANAAAPFIKDTTGAQYAALNAFIENDPALKNARGTIIKRNASVAPFYHRLDLHLNQSIPTIVGQHVDVTLDILNVLNLINHNWGYEQVAAQGDTYALLKYLGRDTNPTSPTFGQPYFQYNVKSNPGTSPTNAFINNATVLNGYAPSRWQALLGIRYTF
jgi:outer membrane receptor for ferrienterochelin and colicin